MNLWSTGTKLVSNMFQCLNGSKRVEIQGIDDKRQVRAVFGGSLTGDFLPVLLVNEGTSPRCYPSTVDFLFEWVITSTPNC